MKYLKSQKHRDTDERRGIGSIHHLYVGLDHEAADLSRLDRTINDKLCTADYILATFSPSSSMISRVEYIPQAQAEVLLRAIAEGSGSSCRNRFDSHASHPRIRQTRSTTTISS